MSHVWISLQKGGVKFQEKAKDAFLIINHHLRPFGQMRILTMKSTKAKANDGRRMAETDAGSDGTGFEEEGTDAELDGTGSEEERTDDDDEESESKLGSAQL